MSEEKRIYVVVAATVQSTDLDNPGKLRHVVQPMGRQIAQACHVVSKLRFRYPQEDISKDFQPATTIILQARDGKELSHNAYQLLNNHLRPVVFYDENLEAYGRLRPNTALAVFATPTEVVGILDYLPLWGS